MRVVFHIGTNKAGSTTIQKTLSAASETLLERGIYYPFIEGQEAHTRLLLAFTDDDEFRKHYGRMNPEKSKETRLVGERMWGELERTIAARTPHTLLLSTEFGVGLRRGSFARLAEALRRKADTLELALYFRDPSSHYLSAVQQGVKFGFRVEDPLIESTYRKDYQKVSGWGADVLRVRVFDRSRLTRGCVFQDFMRQVVGVDEPWLDDVPVRESNLSVSAESMLLLQGFNRVHFSLRRRPGNPLSSAFVAALLEAEGALDVTRPRLVPAMRRVIENDVHADIVWLRDEAGLVFDGFPYESPHEEDEQMRHLRDNHASLQLREVIGVDPARVELLRREVLDQLLAKASSAAAPTSRMHWLPRSLAGWRRLLRFAPRAKASGADGLRKRLFAQQRRREQRRRNQAVDSPEHLQVPFEEAVYFRVLKELLA